MTDYEYGRNIQMVMSSQWESYFADIISERKGQLVSFEVDGELTLSSPPKPSVVLLGIDFTHIRRHANLTISTGSSAQPQSYTVESLSLVWAVHDSQGNVMATEIIGKDGRNVILRFLVDD